MKPSLVVLILFLDMSGIAVVDSIGCICSKCDENDIVCSNQSLNEIPTYYDMQRDHITSIALQENNIKIVNEYSFGNLSNLQTLRLDKNKISSISSKAFYGLPKLNSLYLIRNNISDIPEDMVEESAPLIGFIRLEYNMLRTVPLKFVLKSKKNIKILGNPIHCDCLSVVTDVTLRNLVHGECRTPTHLKGRRISSLRYADVNCEVCSNNPCKNGVCFSKDGGKTSNCSCFNGYTGRYCEKEIEIFSDNAKVNNTGSNLACVLKGCDKENFNTSLAWKDLSLHELINFTFVNANFPPIHIAENLFRIINGSSITTLDDLFRITVVFDQIVKVFKPNRNLTLFQHIMNIVSGYMDIDAKLLAQGQDFSRILVQSLYTLRSVMANVSSDADKDHLSVESKNIQFFVTRRRIGDMRIFTTKLPCIGCNGHDGNDTKYPPLSINKTFDGGLQMYYFSSNVLFLNKEQVEIIKRGGFSKIRTNVVVLQSSEEHPNTSLVKDDSVLKCGVRDSNLIKTTGCYSTFNATSHRTCHCSLWMEIYYYPLSGLKTNETRYTTPSTTTHEIEITNPVTQSQRADQINKITICTGKQTTNCSKSLDVSKEIVEMMSHGTAINSAAEVEKAVSTAESVVYSINNATESKCEIMENILQAASNLLDANSTLLEEAETNSNSSTKIVKLLEKLADKIALTLHPSQRNHSVSTENIALLILPVTHNETFIEADTSGQNKTAIVRKTAHNQHTNLASIKIPVEAMEQAKGSYIFSYFFKKNKFFMTKAIPNLQYIGVSENTVVLSASIGNRSVSNLTNPVVISFKKNDEMTGEEKCKFWDFELKNVATNASGGWSDKGCQTIQSKESDFIECKCNHLTNFALIVDVNQNFNNPLRLKFISWIGCGVSIAGLILTIIVYLSLRTIRQTFASRVLISLCLALMFTLILFIFGVERTSSRLGCQSIAALLQYFILVTFLWMAIEGYNLYRHFINIYIVRKLSTREFIKMSCFAWGTPLVIVALTIVADPEKLGNNKLCLVHGRSFYIGVLLPISIIWFGNMMSLRLSIVNMNKPRLILRESDKKEFKLKVMRVLLCSTLLGVTWIFGILAIGYLRDLFQLLFCVFNSLQGLAIFVLFVICHKDIRMEVSRAWKKNSMEKTTKMYDSYQIQSKGCSKKNEFVRKS